MEMFCPYEPPYEQLDLGEFTRAYSTENAQAVSSQWWLVLIHSNENGITQIVSDSVIPYSIHVADFWTDLG